MKKETENPMIAIRKAPKQYRSETLVASILEASIQVLEQYGIVKFTTARVAERAGVSVGSLYQYFPNKAAILFQLQCDEWQQNTNMIAAILNNSVLSHKERLERLVQQFITSECEEAKMRQALADAAPFYRDAPGVAEIKARGKRVFSAFVQEICEDQATATIKTEVLMRTLGSVGKDFSMQTRTPKQIDQFAEQISIMLCSYLGL